jgi:hypothetical protein
MRKLQYQRDYPAWWRLTTADCAAGEGRPVATNPRLGPALTYLRDLHLVDENGLTKRGSRLASAA